MTYDAGSITMESTGFLGGAPRRRGRRRYGARLSGRCPNSCAARRIRLAIEACGSLHVHAKDIRVQRPNADRDGLLDTLPIERAGDRSWNYVTLGLGHPLGATFWTDFVYTLAPSGTTGR